MLGNQCGNAALASHVQSAILLAKAAEEGVGSKVPKEGNLQAQCNVAFRSWSSCSRECETVLRRQTSHSQWDHSEGGFVKDVPPQQHKAETQYWEQQQHMDDAAKEDALNREAGAHSETQQAFGHGAEAKTATGEDDAVEANQAERAMTYKKGADEEARKARTASADDVRK